MERIRVRDLSFVIKILKLMFELFVPQIFLFQILNVLSWSFMLMFISFRNTLLFLIILKPEVFNFYDIIFLN